MLQRHREFPCAHCGRRRRFRKPKIDHPLHLFLTAVTCGLWGIVWLAVTVNWLAGTPWRCTSCGRRQRRPGRLGATLRGTYEQLSQKAPQW